MQNDIQTDMKLMGACRHPTSIKYTAGAVCCQPATPCGAARLFFLQHRHPHGGSLQLLNSSLAVQDADGKITAVKVDTMMDGGHAMGFSGFVGAEIMNHVQVIYATSASRLRLLRQLSTAAQ